MGPGAKAMSAQGPAWRELFPSLAVGDPASQAVMDGARALALPADQPVFRAGSPCADYVLLLAGSVRVQVIGEGARRGGGGCFGGGGGGRRCSTASCLASPAC